MNVEQEGVSLGTQERVCVRQAGFDKYGLCRTYRYSLLLVCLFVALSVLICEAPAPPICSVRALFSLVCREGKWCPAWVTGMCHGIRAERTPALLTTAFTWLCIPTVESGLVFTGTPPPPPAPSLLPGHDVTHVCEKPQH